MTRLKMNSLFKMDYIGNRLGSAVAARIAIPLVIAALSGFAAPPLSLSTDKPVYLPYEPIYLSIERSNPDDSLVRVSTLEESGYFLEIQPPGGPRYAYKPPLHVCKMGNPNSGSSAQEFSTIITNGRSLVTEKAGTYSFHLVSVDGSSLAWPISFEVVDPKSRNDEAAKKLIETNPFEFGLFMYMEGGDHLEDGHKIVRQLAEIKSGYQAKAAAVLAINYSHDALSAKTGRVMREKDPAEMRKYFIRDGEELPRYLLLRKSHSVLVHMQDGEIPEDVKTRVRSVVQSHSNGQAPEFFRKLRKL